MSLSAFLKRAGYRDVEVLHLDALPASGEHLKGKLREFKPDIVGIGAMTAQAKSMHAAARLVKELLPEALVLVGGAHPTHYPEDCANDPAIDAAVLHEGELTLLELVVLRRDGRAVRTRAREFIEDLDSLPFPDYDAVDLEAYRNLMPCSILAYRQKYTSVMTSRGCPYHCTFCHRVMGKKFRAQSPERALSELTLLHERYGIDHIEMIDDIANCSPERFKAILRGLIARGLGLKIYLAAGLRADLLRGAQTDIRPGTLHAGLPRRDGGRHVPDAQICGRLAAPLHDDRFLLRLSGHRTGREPARGGGHEPRHRRQRLRRLLFWKGSPPTRLADEADETPHQSDLLLQSVQDLAHN